jgi:hypothetical protein
VYLVDSAYDDCGAPLMLELELRDDRTAIVTQRNTSISAPWGMIGDDPWLLDLSLDHAGLRWDANPLKLERHPDGHTFVGQVACHSEIGPWRRGTLTLTRPDDRQKKPKFSHGYVGT